MSGVIPSPLSQQRLGLKYVAEYRNFCEPDYTVEVISVQQSGYVRACYLQITQSWCFKAIVEAAVARFGQELPANPVYVVPVSLNCPAGTKFRGKPYIVLNITLPLSIAEPPYYAASGRGDYGRASGECILQMRKLVITTTRPVISGAHRYTVRREAESPLDHGVDMRFGVSTHNSHEQTAQRTLGKNNQYRAGDILRESRAFRRCFSPLSEREMLGQDAQTIRDCRDTGQHGSSSLDSFGRSLDSSSQGTM
eukprot:6214842-Pleurochrysis_carterae.AAC.2